MQVFDTLPCFHGSTQLSLADIPAEVSIHHTLCPLRYSSGSRQGVFTDNAAFLTTLLFVCDISDRQTVISFHVAITSRERDT